MTKKEPVTNQILFTFYLIAAMLTWPAIAVAQDGPAIGQPTAELNTLFAVVRAQGAVLINDESGAVEGAIKAGSLVVTLARSEQDGLLYVQSEDGERGWVSASSLLIVNPTNVPVQIPSFRQSNDEAQMSSTVVTVGDVVDFESGRSRPNNSSASSSNTSSPITINPNESPMSRPLTVAEALSRRSNSTIEENSQEESTTEDTTEQREGNTGEDTVSGEVNLRLNNLNLRNGPGTDYPLTGSAAPESLWTILGQSEDGSWVQVASSRGQNKDKRYWAATRFLTIQGTLNEVTVITDVAPPPEPRPEFSLATESAAPQGSGVFGLSGTLAFQDRIGGTIYIYRFATGQLTPITGGVDPAISPDGRMIAFTRDGGGSGLYVINADGSNERIIFNERDMLRSPKWSPDGTKIVFSRGNGYDECRVLSGSVCFPDEKILDSLPPGLQGGDAKNLVRDLDLNREYFFSLARVGVDGSDYRDVPGLSKSTAPDWEAGGIVYQSDVGIQVTADRGDARSQQIAHDPNQGYFHDPDWQPNGGRIVFHRKMGQHWQLFGVNADGSGLAAMTRPITALVDELPSNVSPAWSPDGQHIIYLSNRNSIESAGAWHFWIMDADGGNQRLLPVDIPLEYTYSSEQMVSWGR